VCCGTGIFRGSRAEQPLTLPGALHSTNSFQLTKRLYPPHQYAHRVEHRRQRQRRQGGALQRARVGPWPLFASHAREAAGAAADTGVDIVSEVSECHPRLVTCRKSAGRPPDEEGALRLHHFTTNATCVQR